MEERIDKAVELFMSGYGCCQSVVGAFADMFGMPHEQAMAVAAGFGGGVGRMRMMCGAVSGLVILAGLSCGQTEADDRAGKSRCYKVVQELLAKFKERNGSIVCAELLGLEGNVQPTGYVPAERNAYYYKTRPCAAKVESAARVFAEFLKEKQRNPKESLRTNGQ